MERGGNYDNTNQGMGGINQNQQYNNQLNQQYTNQFQQQGYYPNQGMPIGNQYYMNPEPKHSKMGIAAFILALLGCTSILGLIFGIIDLWVNKRNKHGLSIAAIVISVLWLMMGAVSTTSDGNESKTEEPKSVISSSQTEDDSLQSEKEEVEAEEDSEAEDDSSESSNKKKKKSKKSKEQSKESDSESNNVENKEEFISSCETYSYDKILRNPDKYKNVNCVLSGDVSQIIQGWFGSYTIYISDIDGNKWGCTYSYRDEESHVLEGDSVTVYGILNGTTKTETVLGKQVEMPYIEIEYIELSEYSAEESDDTSGMTMGQKNAVKSAKSYLEYSSFSRNGLINQLSSEYGEGYSIEDAEYAVKYLEDNNKVDWNEQAYKSAKSYLEYSSFSRDGLYDQLTSEYGAGFTAEQAEYALEKVGY